jgi:drug/metabolite transporter (DMT)-like permease
MNSARIKAYLALAICALIWGAAQPLVKPALQYIAPLQYMFLRYTFALPIALIVLIIMVRKTHIHYHDTWKIIAIEIINLINLLILYTGLKYTSALQSALILSTRPIFTTFMGICFMKDKEETHEWLGLVLSVLGIGLVIIAPFFHQFDLFTSSNVILGNSLVILTNIIAMVSTYFSKKTYKKISKIYIGIVNVIFGSFFFLCLNLIQYHTLPFASLVIPSVLLPVLYMAMFGTMLALTLQVYGYNLIEISEAALFQYLEPLIYIPLTIFWLKEPVSIFQFVGLFIIIIGVSMAAARLPKQRHKYIFHGLPKLARLRLAEEPILIRRQPQIHDPWV